MLTISGAIIFTCTNMSLKLKFKYPVVNCELINADYGPTKDKNGLEKMTKAVIYQDSAI